MNKPKNFSTTFATYTVSAVLGQGGSGIVFSAITEDGEDVAIKCLDPKYASREKLKRFKNEFSFCSRTEHPNIVRVIDHGLTENGESFFVMPAYESSLRPLIGNLQPKEALMVFSKILDGVDAAHKLGVVHRDLKPENILVRESGQILAVADFGIARFEEEELYTAVETKDGTRLANFQYAAPEQRTRGKEVGYGADIYALGLILNELFTGEVPHGTKFRQIAEVSDDHSYLDAIVEGMLGQKSSHRPASVEAIKKDLIARGNEFVARQKLSRTKKQVISVDDLDDPLVDDPIQIIGVDWENNTLTIKLSQNTNQNWVWAINNMGGHTSLMGKGPESFRFSDNTAVIGSADHEAQEIINYFKQWLPRANQVYSTKLKQDRAAEEHRLRKELEAKVKAEEKRANVLSDLKF